MAVDCWHFLPTQPLHKMMLVSNRRRHQNDPVVLAPGCVVQVCQIFLECPATTAFTYQMYLVKDEHAETLQNPVTV
jgi:hypothetical protein